MANSAKQLKASQVCINFYVYLKLFKVRACKRCTLSLYKYHRRNKNSRNSSQPSSLYQGFLNAMSNFKITLLLAFIDRAFKLVGRLSMFADILDLNGDFYDFTRNSFPANDLRKSGSCLNCTLQQVLNIFEN